MAINMAKSYGHWRIRVNMKSSYVVGCGKGRFRRVKKNNNQVQELYKAMRSGIKVTWRFIEKNSRGGNIEEAD